jgi:hypothetical protein
MKAIREIELHEFREHLESCLQSGETIAVMQNRQRVGTFIPTLPRHVEPDTCPVVGGPKAEALG